MAPLINLVKSRRVMNKLRGKGLSQKMKKNAVPKVKMSNTLKKKLIKSGKLKNDPHPKRRTKTQIREKMKEEELERKMAENPMKKVEKLHVRMKARQTFALNMSEDVKFRNNFFCLKRQQTAQAQEKKKRGVIHISNIPYGFFEEQMSSYFEQFGDLLNVRHARSPKTGRSCGWGYVEFMYPEVAKLVAHHMDGYLTFGKIMKCQMVPPEHVTDKMFQGKDISEDWYPALEFNKRNILELTCYRSRGREKSRKSRLMYNYQDKVLKLKKLGIDLDLLANVVKKKSKNENTAEGEVMEVKEEEEEEEENEEVEEEEEEDDDEVEMTEEQRKEMGRAREDLAVKIKVSLAKAEEEKAKDGAEQMVLEVDESDDEIQFKTPPHAVKKFVKMTSASTKLEASKAVKSLLGSDLKKKKTVKIDRNNEEDDTPVALVTNGVSHKVIPVKRNITEETLTGSVKKRKISATLASANNSTEKTPTSKGTPKSNKEMGSSKNKVQKSELLANITPVCYNLDLQSLVCSEAKVKETQIKKTPKKAKCVQSLSSEIDKMEEAETAQTPKIKCIESLDGTPNNYNMEEEAEVVQIKLKTPKKVNSVESLDHVEEEAETVQIKLKTPKKVNSVESLNGTVQIKRKTPKKVKSVESVDGTPNKASKKLKKTSEKVTVNQEVGTVTQEVFMTPKGLKTPKQSPGKLLKSASKQTPGKSVKKTPKQSPAESLISTPKQTPGKSAKKTPKQSPAESLISTPKQTPDKSAKKTPKQSPAESLISTPKQIPCKSAKKTPKQSPAESLISTPKQTPGKSAKKTPKQSPAESLISTPKQTPGKSAKKTPKQSPAESLISTPKQTPGKSAKKTPKQSPAESLICTPKQIPCKSAKKTPKQSPAESLISTPKQTPGKSAKKTPKQSPAESLISTPKQTADKSVKKIKKTPKKVNGIESLDGTPNYYNIEEAEIVKMKRKTPKKVKNVESVDMEEEAETAKIKLKTPKKVKNVESVDGTPNKSSKKTSEKVTVNQEVGTVTQEVFMTPKGLKTPKQSPGKLLKSESKQTPGKSAKKTPKLLPNESLISTPKQTPGKSAKKTPKQSPGESVLHSIGPFKENPQECKESSIPQDATLKDKPLSRKIKRLQKPPS